ncbi:MAG: hypothetical protein V1859_01735 [archaeon]
MLLSEIIAVPSAAIMAVGSHSGELLKNIIFHTKKYSQLLNSATVRK